MFQIVLPLYNYTICVQMLRVSMIISQSCIQIYFFHYYLNIVLNSFFLSYLNTYSEYIQKKKT